MTEVILSPRRRDRPRPAALWRSGAASAARGAALVGLAVLIGIVLLQVVDDGTTGPIGDGGGTAPATTTTTAAPGTTTSTKAAGEVRPPQQVTVLVLNGSGRSGAASAQTNALKAKGYQTLTPADAPRREGTVVYFRPGFEREAAALATAVGGTPEVAPMPDTPPPGSEGADCVVILGL
jgi:hypothetical protein